MAESENSKSMLAKNWPVVVPIGVLVLILICFMFLFIIDENDHVIVTRFGDPQLQRDTSPGLAMKLPYPIEEVWRHDKRIHVFPSSDSEKPAKAELEEVFTKDNTNIIVSVSLTWSVWADESLADVKDNIVKYMNNVGTVQEAEVKLNDLVRSAKTAIFGKHSYRELINRGKAEGIRVIEKELLDYVRNDAQKLYAIDVRTLTISHLGLPEKTTGEVIKRMISERQREANFIKAEGKKNADITRAQADRESRDLISEARKKATDIKAKGDEEAAKSYQTFQKAPELALFLKQLDALKTLVDKRTFLYLDFTTPPLNLMSPEMYRNLKNNKLKIGTSDTGKAPLDKGGLETDDE